MSKRKKVSDNLEKEKTHKKIGKPPGSLEYTGDKKDIKTEITIIDYNQSDFHIERTKEINQDLSDIESPYKRWIIVDGIRNVPIIEKIGKQFNLHPLVLEDILNPTQPPKFEDYKDYIFIVLKKLLWYDNEEEFRTEQISCILGKNYVISFTEDTSDIFNYILERIKIPKGIIRKKGADYLLYSIIDVIIDNYFILQEILETYIEEIEDKLIEDPQIETLQETHKLKRNVIDFRKSIWPLREFVNKFQRIESELISKDIYLYIRDLYDHIFKINDTIQTYRDIVSGLLDMYLSSVSNKMNDIMKVLTIISTIFIPLSFIAGFYGMNFLYMPELRSPLGYPILIGVMITIAIGMLMFFRHKDWI